MFGVMRVIPRPEIVTVVEVSTRTVKSSVCEGSADAVEVDEVDRVDEGGGVVNDLCAPALALAAVSGRVELDSSESASVCWLEFSSSTVVLVEEKLVPMLGGLDVEEFTLA